MLLTVMWLLVGVGGRWLVYIKKNQILLVSVDDIEDLKRQRLVGGGNGGGPWGDDEVGD